MPIYEYRCETCGKKFEVIQKFSDAPLTAHEGCGGHVERLISPPALQFKGSGWYVTDYAGGKSSESKSDAKAEGKSDAKTETKKEPAPTETKSESKPAATTTKTE